MGLVFFFPLKTHRNLLLSGGKLVSGTPSHGSVVFLGLKCHEACSCQWIQSHLDWGISIMQTSILYIFALSFKLVNLYHIHARRANLTQISPFKLFKKLRRWEFPSFSCIGSRKRHSPEQESRILLVVIPCWHLAITLISLRKYKQQPPEASLGIFILLKLGEANCCTRQGEIQLFSHMYLQKRHWCLEAWKCMRGKKELWRSVQVTNYPIFHYSRYSR